MVLVCLVKNAQHHVEPVVDLSVQSGNLDNDAVMGQAFHKGVRQSLCYDILVVVTGLVAHVQYGFFYLPHLMTKQIDGHHRKRIVAGHILRIAVLHPQILAEAQRLRLYPRLLQLHKDKTLRAVGLTDGGSEVYAEHRQVLALVVAILMRTYLHARHVLFQKCRQDGSGYTLVFHQIFEHHVVYRIRYYHIASFLIGCLLQRYEKELVCNKKRASFVWFYMKIYLNLHRVSQHCHFLHFLHLMLIPSDLRSFSCT